MSGSRARQWHFMVSQSFEPRQWYDEDGDRPATGGVIPMWVYRQSGDLFSLFLVGFFDPGGVWHEDSKVRTKDEAAARVNFLNGGGKATPPAKIKEVGQ